MANVKKLTLHPNVRPTAEIKIGVKTGHGMKRKAAIYLPMKIFINGIVPIRKPTGNEINNAKKDASQFIFNVNQIFDIK